MSADHPLLLALAPLAGLVAFGLGWYARRRRVRAAAAWSERLGQAARRYARFGVPVVALAAALAAVGAAGPRWGTAEVGTESRALNLVLAIDISRSMLAEDVAPSRLGRAVREARRLLQDSRGDRVALLAFAGRSYILAPLTLDDAAIRLHLDALDPEVASEGGTEMATVLRQGAQVLEAASEGGARAFVLFTDGEAHDSLAGVAEAARALRRVGATVIVVGEGSPTPTRIPIRDPGGALIRYHLDADGREVQTARRDDVLRLIADAAQGVLVPSDLPDQAGTVRRTLAGLDRSTARGRRTEDLVPRAWWFALAAAVLLAGQAARRRAALLALTGVTLAGPAAAQRPGPGQQPLARGDSARALDVILRSAAGARPGDTVWYNAGTLALLAGRDSTARAALENASGALDPTLRFRALYNLGLRALLRSRADTAGRQAHEEEAVRHFREALLLDPAHAAAKRNLELVSRRRPPPSGGQSPQHGRGGGGQGSPPPSAESGMGRAEAEQILASVERAEQAARADQLRRRRTARSAMAKDW